MKWARFGDGNTITGGSWRPDVEVEVAQHEALVRVGRHEQLFVWPPEDAEPAMDQVISYVLRITRSGSLADSLTSHVERLTREQVELVGRLDEVLRSPGAVSDLRVTGPARESHAELLLLLPPERSLDVRILVGTDGFELYASGVVLRLDRIDFGDEGPVWIDACVHTLEALLRHDLVLRMRPTLGFRRTGAVRIPDRQGGECWNGDPLACLGLGRLRTIRDWWSPR